MGFLLLPPLAAKRARRLGTKPVAARAGESSSSTADEMRIAKLQSSDQKAGLAKRVFGTYRPPLFRRFFVSTDFFCD